MNKEVKQNDMLLATLANPSAKPYDFISNNVNSLNTQLLDRDFYKNKQVIKDQFTTPEGKFDEVGFDTAYKIALHNFNQISNEEALKSLDNVEFDPFDVTRPIGSKVYNVDVKFSNDYNPFKQLYSRSSINSIDESPFSLREIAQQGKIYDPNTGQWSKSVNKLGLFDKLFGDTLVYAQWDEDGIHVDPINGQTVKHKAGDWKLDPEGNLFLEKLGGREVYGKQVVSISDILTTDGSALNKALDFFDSDGKEKSVGRVAVKTMVEIAPLLIPGFGTTYGGMRAAVGLASVLPTFFKSMDSLLRGDSTNYGKDPITKAEGWMAKFSQQSSSDAGSEGFWNFEQMSNMVSSIFTQIFEQRAMASLSTMLMRPDKMLHIKRNELMAEAAKMSIANGVNPNRAVQMILQQSPELKKAYALQSKLSKAFSLGYMALTSTGDIYGEAIESGYDRRTAGFAALLAASGQYGIMMNNPMSDWFLDETTGYHVNVSRGAMRKALIPYLDDFQKVLTDSKLSTAVKRNKLAELAMSAKKSMHNWFSSGGTNAIFRNMLTEGMEEVTEEVVLDATKGIVEVMGYLGLTKDKGTFRTIERYTSGEAFQEYLANFVGGLLGGGLFEIERSKLGPWLANKGKLSPETHRSLVELVASGYKEDLIKMVKQEAKYLGNNTLSYVQDSETSEDFKPAEAVSQSDLIAEKTIEIIEQLDILLNTEGLALTDEEILQKAIRTELVLQGLENSKEEGKHYGIEGLIIDDFRNASVEIAKIRGVINDLETQENSEAQIKLEKEKLKPHKETINSILSGEKTMKYFDQITTYLNEDIRRTFGSLDKYNYIKTKYDVDYRDLPDSGLGLTKKVADEEWDEFLESTDIKKKLSIITDSYKELEKVLNPTISEYVDSGYYEVRREVQKNILDLQKTIQLFNTAVSDKVRNEAINNFIKINQNLESLGLTKVLPYDAYITDIATQLFDEGYIRKKRVKDDGSIEYEEYTDAELNQKIGDKTLKQRITDQFNSIARNFPFNPINLEYIIHNVNASIDQNNAQLLNNIDLIRKSDPKGERVEEVKYLESLLMDFNVKNFEETDIYKGIMDTYYDNLRTAFGEIGVTGDNALEEGEQKLNLYKRISKNPEVFEEGNLSEMITKANATASNIEDLSNTEKLGLLQVLVDKGVLKESFIMNPFEEGTKENFKKYVEALESNSEVDKDFEEKLFKSVDNTITEALSLLNTPNIEDVLKESEQLRKDLLKEVGDKRPQQFKIRNLAFDILVDALSKKEYKDKELFNLAKGMFDQETDSILKIMFPGITTTNPRLLTSIIDGSLDLNDLISGITKADAEGFYLEGGIDEFGEEYKAATVADMEADREALENDTLLNFALDYFSPDTTLETINKAINNAVKAKEDYADKINSLTTFLNLSEDGLKANPLYDKLRAFSMVMNSNPKSPINKILDILEREEMSYKAVSGVSAYTADGIRSQDIQQAIDLLDMFDVVINNMSTTSFEGEGITGFIAMRQQYAKLSGITDDVTSLKTIDSDQAAIMSRDIKAIRSKLQFLKDLADFNAKKIANEYENVRTQMGLVFDDIWKSLLDHSELTPFLPNNLADILNSKDPTEAKLIKAETAFYEHNKNNKEEALEAILKVLNNFDYSDKTSYTSETTVVSDYNKVIYFATVLATNAEDYAKKSIISLEGNLNKAPFYSQEVGARTIVAHTINPELFNKIFEVKQNNLNADANYTSFILGSSGTGKTTVLVGQVLDILRQTNGTSNIWLAAPSQDQAIKLTNDVKDSIGEENLAITTLSKSKLFSMFGQGIKDIHDKITADLSDLDNTTESDYVYLDSTGRIIFNLDESWESLIEFDKLPNILVIDEITHFSKAEIQLLDFISRKSFSNSSSNFMKFVGAGDTTQRGFKAYSKQYKQYVDYNVDNLNAVYTAPLNLSVRAANDQKRTNTDLLQGLLKKGNSLYDKAEKDAAKQGIDVNYKGLDTQFLEWLKDPGNNLGLKYFKDKGKVEGDLILNSYKELSAFNSIKNALEENPKLILGVLTKNGKIDPELLEALDNAGFTKDMIDRIKIFTPDNVQGSEVDYFIFDMSIIEDFDKVLDTLSSFYTFTTRSTTGTLIIDSNKDLYNKLNIENTDPSTYSVIYDPLSPQVVKDLKDNRIEKLKEYVGDNLEISEDSNYRWRTGEESTEEQFTDELKNVPSISPDASENKFIDTEESTEQTVYPKSKGIVQDDFGIMFHTFYNNPGAVVTLDDKGNYTSIKVNSDKPRTDLNGISDVTNAEQIQKILTEWGRLRSELLRKEVKNKSTTSYNNFFEHIFGKNEIGNVEIKLVRTASIFDKEINTPLKKFGYLESELIKDGEPFLNIMAELKLKGKVHYITLATMAKLSTIKEKGLSNLIVKDGDPAAVREAIGKEIEEKLKLLNDRLVFLKKNGQMPMVKLGDLPFEKDGKRTINLVTSTRLLGKKETGKDGKVKDTRKKHYLIDLSRDFLGMYHSEVRIFPNTDKGLRNLINKYTFGKAKNEETILRQLKLFKGKPYIVVSFNNDLEGGSTNNITSKLVPINAESRNLDTLISEVAQIKKELNEEVSEHFKGVSGEDYASKKKSYKVSDSINIRTESLLDRSQILDILIEWEQTPYEDGTLLDLYTKEVEVSSVKGEALKRKISLIQVLDNFKKSNDDSLSENSRKLLEVIKAVKANVGEADPKERKEKIIGAISNWTGWSWSFHNIFAFHNAIESQKDRAFNKILQGFMIDEDMIISEDTYKQIEAYGEALINKLREDPDRKFFYSIPIVAAGESRIKVNPEVSGERGFKTKFFADKFYINQTPESERGILSLGIYRDIDLNKITPLGVIDSPKVEVVSETVPEMTAEPEVKVEETVEEIIQPEVVGPTITSIFKDVMPSFVDFMTEMGKLDSEQKNVWETKLRKIEPLIGVRQRSVYDYFTQLVTNIYEDMKKEDEKNGTDKVSTVTFTNGELDSAYDLFSFFNLTEDQEDQLMDLAEKIIDEHKKCK